MVYVGRAKNWYFTIYNPSSPLTPSVWIHYCSNLVYQLQCGSATGILYYYGYVRFDKQLTMSQVKDCLGTSAYLQVARRSSGLDYLSALSLDMRAPGDSSGPFFYVGPISRPLCTTVRTSGLCVPQLVVSSLPSSSERVAA